jgi:dissimilatory sulfite reductase (desulfoviridin) alpha/beta subunit
MKPREEIKVEASNCHYGVICINLVLNQEIGSSIPDKGKAIVVGGVKGLEKGRACGEERNVLNIGVVFGHVSYEMMNIVAALPPAN